MFVYVSDLCWQHAKEHQIEDKINELKKWIEQGDFRYFTKEFEIFSHPYYVRKKLAYYYRLIARHTEVIINDERHGVAVFFRLFHRSDKGYDDFYYHTVRQGDMLYNQQKLDDKVIEYVKACLENTQKEQHNQTLAIDESTALSYFFQARVNLFDFKPCPSEYYQASAFWWHTVAKKCTTKDGDTVFSAIQNGLANANPQNFDIQGTPLTFVPSPIPTLSEPNAIPSPFNYKCSVDILWDKSLWFSSHNYELPIYLNTLGNQVCDVIFNEGQAFPLIVDAAHLHGKTSLLSLLTIHYHYQNDPDATGLPCLLIQPNRFDDIGTHAMLDSHGLMLSRDLNLDHIDIKNSCYTPLSLLKDGIKKSANFSFDETLYIDELQFFYLWQNHTLAKQPEFKSLHAEFIWHILQHYIKGGYEFDGVCSYDDQELFDLIYQKVYQEWYKSLAQEGYWDLHDLCLYFNQNQIPHLTYKALLLDDCHAYSKLVIYTLLKHSAYHKVGKLFFQSPLIFMGNAKYNLDWQNNIDAVLSYLQKELNHQDTIKTKKINQQAEFIGSQDLIFSHYHTLVDRQFNPEKWRLFDYYGYHEKKSDIVFKPNTIINKNIYFVNSQDTKAMLALFSCNLISIYTNHKQETNFEYFANHADIGQIFSLCSPTLFYNTHNNDNAYNKPSYQIALFGFCEDWLKDLANHIKNSSIQQLNQTLFLLNRLEKTFEQSLNTIYLVGNDDELQVWQQFFDINHQENHAIQTVDANHIYAEYQSLLATTNQQKQLALEKLSTQPDDSLMTDFTNIADNYLDLYQYQAFLDTIFQSCQINGDYDPFFEELVSEPQKEYGFGLIWHYRYQNLWLKYADLCPKSMLGNLLALQLIHQETTAYPPQKAYQLALQSYLAQYENEQLVHYWKNVINLLLEQLSQTSVHEFHLIDDALSQLAEQKYYLPFLTVANIYYQYQYFDKAFTYWQLAEYYEFEVPDTYYELSLTLAKNWIYTLIPLLQLDRLGEFMNTFADHDINELRLEHWEKILPYLKDHPEVETILNALLPQIQSVDVLNKILEHCQYDVNTRFVERLQRLLTLNACLVGDWQTINTRLAHYVPAETSNVLEKLSHHFLQTQIKQGKTVAKKTVVMPKFHKPHDEVVDIIYALNLNPEFKLTNDWDEYSDYCQKPHIRSIFAQLRQIFSVKSENSDWERQWNTRFPAVRALAFLLEKSDSTLDAQALYTFIAHDPSNKDTLKNLAIERNRLLLKRADRFANLDKQAMLEQMDSDTLTPDMEEALLLRWGDIEEMQKDLLAHFSKELEKLSGQDELVAPPAIKTAEELINSIMTLNDKEQRELKELEKEQKRIKKEAEAKAEQERLEAERLEKERLKAERLEQERLEQERLTQERAEQERLEQERLELERLEQERLEAERLAEAQRLTQLEQERLEQEKVEQERLAQQAQAIAEQSEQEQLANQRLTLQSSQFTQSPLPPMPKPLATTAIVKGSQPAISELHFFGFRVFVARLYGRVNLENMATGERCSLLADGTLYSDWAYQSEGNAYYLVGAPIVLEKLEHQIRLTHTEHGMSLLI